MRPAGSCTRTAGPTRSGCLSMERAGWRSSGSARGTRWRPGQRAVAGLFVSLGIPYCLARSERGVIDALDAILAFPEPYKPLEMFGKVYAVEDDPRL